MSRVVNLKDFSLQRAANRCVPVWTRRFSEPLTSETMLGDLSDPTLNVLAHVGDEVMNLVNELVMAALNLGRASGYQGLPGVDRIRILDAALYFIDQVRWECLARLGWAAMYAGEVHPLMELILDHHRIKAEYHPKFPHLTPKHPDYAHFQQYGHIEGETIIRRIIPVALTVFAQRAQ